MNALTLFGLLVFWGWLSFSAFVICGLLGFLLYRPRKTEHATVKDLEFVIISVANQSVKPALLDCIKHHRRQFPDYQINLVIDEGCELESELRDLKAIKLSVVPSDFRKDLTGKGRAIQYFIGSRNNKTWYAFLDDDNLILDDSFLHEIPYYSSRGYAAANPILVPRPGKSKTAYTMDFVRLFDDRTIFRFFTGLLSKPLLGLHGELLIAQGCTLNSAGTYSQRSITEDYLFSTYINRSHLKTWQSATRISIKSPNSVADLIRQRQRWCSGISSDLRSAPGPQKYLSQYRIILWKLGGLFSPLAAAVLLAFRISAPPWLFPLFAIGGSYYYLAYFLGASKSGSIRSFICIPFYGIIESYAALRSRSGQKTFEVIDKR